MSTLKRNLLLIGPWDASLSEAGAAIAPTLAAALGQPRDSWDVIGVSATVLMESRFVSYHDEVRALAPWTRLVAALPRGLPAQQLIELHRRFQPDKVLDGMSRTDAEHALYEAQEQAQRLRQQVDLERLLREQERRLEVLRLELESRVEKRTRLLAESRHNLHLRNRRLEVLGKALMAVQAASSIPEMENLLSESLASAIEISWIRVIPGRRDEEFERQIARMEGFTWQNVPLWRHQDRIGSVFFMRPLDRPFRREDVDVLNKISEAIALALDRITKLREAETVKEQWDATFSAIASPMALIDADDRVLQANVANPEGRPCYKLLFDRDEPCRDCGRGRGFRLRHGDRTFEVHSQTLVLEPGQHPVYAHLYSDVTERLRMETRILESAKMAELGTIGSSIAHELNNPIGGILNFAQLMKMELPSDHHLRPDLDAIEDGARRCKEIVENLLGFSRRSPGGASERSDLRDVVERAVKLADLRARPLGIVIEVQRIDEPAVVRGSANLLAHALRNLIDRSIDLTLEKRGPSNPAARATARVRLTLARERESFVFSVSDGGPADGGRPTLALQIAEQILREAGAEIDWNGPSSPDPRAKISFSRPVLGS